MQQAFRLAIVLVTFAIGFGVYWAIDTGNPAHPHRRLQSLPMVLGSWRGAEDALPADTLAVLGVDDYILRHYHGLSRVPVTLYIAYYGSPRLNQRIHAPSACLPSGGWLPIEAGSEEIPLPNVPQSRITANRYLVEKGLNRQVVLYWFEGRGRVVANDVMAALFLAYDTLSGRGRDEMLVRISAPVPSTSNETLAAELRFTQVLYPLLQRLLAGS